MKCSKKNTLKDDEELESQPALEDKLDPEQLGDGEYVICPGCGDKMPKTIATCVSCGAKLKHTTYVPISEKKASRIRAIVGVVLVVAFFLIWFIVMN